MKEPITIITSVYHVSDESLLRLAKSVKSQKYKGKIRHIFINDNPRRKISIPGAEVINHEKSQGLARVLNEGFKKAKTEYLVSLQDDCLPSSNNWLSTLIAPLEEKDVAATTSNVELPKKFWESFDYFTRALTEKEQRVITPGLDEKGCAYKKSALEEFGYLDEKAFKNGGEDTDLTVKIQQSKRWRFIQTSAKVYHFHHFTLKSRIKKEIQYARLSGLVSRKHFFRLPLNFQLHIALRIVVGLGLIVSLISSELISLWILAAIFLSNIRLPSQVKKLGDDSRIILVPFLNLYIYVLYFFNFLYALIFNPIV